MTSAGTVSVSASSPRPVVTVTGIDVSVDAAATPGTAAIAAPTGPVASTTKSALVWSAQLVDCRLR